MSGPCRDSVIAREDHWDHDCSRLGYRRPTDYSKQRLEQSTRWGLCHGRVNIRPGSREPTVGLFRCDFDTIRVRKTKGLAGNHRLTPILLGFPTWARTKDLSIDRTTDRTLSLRQIEHRYESFDDLICLQDKHLRDLQPQSCRSLAVDNKSKLGWLLNGKIARLFALQDPRRIGGHSSKGILENDAVTHQSANRRCVLGGPNGSNTVAKREFGNFGFHASKKPSDGT